MPPLVAAGHEVSALARSPSKAAALRGHVAKPVEVSLFDVPALTDTFAGHDAVVNLATAIPPMNKFLSSRAWAANQRVRTEGSAAVVEAALATGVGRLVQESVCMLYADGGDAWLDEDAVTDRYPMAEGNHAAEANARRFGGVGGSGDRSALRLVLRPRGDPQPADAGPGPPPRGPPSATRKDTSRRST